MKYSKRVFIDSFQFGFNLESRVVITDMTRIFVFVDHDHWIPHQWTYTKVISKTWGIKKMFSSSFYMRLLFIFGLRSKKKIVAVSESKKMSCPALKYAHPTLKPCPEIQPVAAIDSQSIKQDIFSSSKINLAMFTV